MRPFLVLHLIGFVLEGICGYVSGYSGGIYNGLDGYGGGGYSGGGGYGGGGYGSGGYSGDRDYGYGNGVQRYGEQSSYTGKKQERTKVTFCVTGGMKNVIFQYKDGNGQSYRVYSREDGTALATISGPYTQVTAKYITRGEEKIINKRDLRLYGDQQKVEFDTSVSCATIIKMINAEQCCPLENVQVLYSSNYGVTGVASPTKVNGKTCVQVKAGQQLRVVAGKAGFLVGNTVSIAPSQPHKVINFGLAMNFLERENLKMLLTIQPIADNPRCDFLFAIFQYSYHSMDKLCDVVPTTDKECPDVTTHYCKANGRTLTGVATWQNTQHHTYRYVVAVKFKVNTPSANQANIVMFDKRSGSTKLLSMPGNMQRKSGYWLIGCFTDDNLKHFIQKNILLNEAPNLSHCKGNLNKNNY